MQVEVYKDPVTDSGKKSKKGQLTLEIKDGKYVTMTQGTGDPKNVSNGHFFATTGNWWCQMFEFVFTCSMNSMFMVKTEN